MNQLTLEANAMVADRAIIDSTCDYNTMIFNNKHFGKHNNQKTDMLLLYLH